MAGFREPETPEIGLSSMLFEWPTACSRNTGMCWRMKRPKPSLKAVCRCSGRHFPSERSEFAAPGRVRSSSTGPLWLELDGDEAAERHALGAGEQRSGHYAPPHKQRSNTRPCRLDTARITYTSLSRTVSEPLE